MLAKDNPFSMDRVHTIRYRFLSGSWSDFLRRLEAHDFRGAIVGPEGSGKTTLLEDLVPALRKRGLETRWLQLSSSEVPDKRQLFAATTKLNQQDVLLLDGAEQLGPWMWRKVLYRCRRAGGLIITSHRPGRLPTVLECSTTPGLFGTIVAELTAGVAIPPTELGTLYHDHNGNVRDALRAMYDRCALS